VGPRRGGPKRSGAKHLPAWTAVERARSIRRALRRGCRAVSADFEGLQSGKVLDRTAQRLTPDAWTRDHGRSRERNGGTSRLRRQRRGRRHLGRRRLRRDRIGNGIVFDLADLLGRDADPAAALHLQDGELLPLLDALDHDRLAVDEVDDLIGERAGHAGA